MKMLKKLLELSRDDLGLLIEALCWLSLTNFLLLIVPFKHIAPHLGKHMIESSNELDVISLEQANRIGWAIKVIANRIPWESRCLAQALAAKRMFQKRDINTTLYLGLTNDEQDELIAHAWLRYGPQIITGNPGHEHFVVLSTFAEAGESYSELRGKLSDS